MIRKCIKFLKKIKFIIEGHPFLTGANIISLVLGLLPTLYTLIFFEWENKIPSLILLPFILVTYFISVCSYFIFKKFPKLSRIFSFLLNSFVIIIIQFFIGFFVIGFISAVDTDTKCNKIENYPMALKYLWEDAVAHFPQKIPNSAKNIHFKTSTFSFFGGQDIFLRFDIDSEYIDNELKKYSYVKIVSYEDIKNEDNYSFPFQVHLDGFVLYVIGDRNHYKGNERHFPFHYGIAVNKKNNQILYYYENPD